MDGGAGQSHSRTISPSCDSSHASLGGGTHEAVMHFSHQKPPLPSPVTQEPRHITFRKEGGSVGVRVIGGNEVGIFVSAVQSDSPAALRGVKPGDKLLRVNNKSMVGVTREEAVLFLLGLQDQVDLLVQHKKDEYEQVRCQNIGDNFFIRVHFDYDKPEHGEMGFKKGDIFQITDTLFGGTVGSWQALCVLSPSSSSKMDNTPMKGVIPNMARASRLANVDRAREHGRSPTEPKSSTLLRKKMLMGRRSKSLTKAHWDEVIFSHGTIDFAAYERVQLRHPGFLRPVVIYGTLADIAREQLLRDFPLAFSSAQIENTNGTENASSGIVRLAAIRNVMKKNKHCILDITPSSVEKLIYAQYCPIVIFVNVESRSRLRELRKRYSKAAAMKSSKKLHDQAVRIQKLYSYLFTAVIDVTYEDKWFELLRDLIAHLQNRRVWMSETKPSELLDDDFLFPMANVKYGSFGGGDSDLDSTTDEPDYGTSQRRLMSQGSNDTLKINAPYIDAKRTLSDSLSSPLKEPSRTQFDDRFDLAANVEANIAGYENRECILSHLATMQRKPPLVRKVKPLPPPRSDANHSSFSSDLPASLNFTDARVGSVAVSAPSATVSDTVAVMPNSLCSSHADKSHRRTTTTTKPDEPAMSPYPQRYYSHGTDTGFYDVKQVLEGNFEDYDPQFAYPSGVARRVMSAEASSYPPPRIASGNLSTSYYDNSDRLNQMDYRAMYNCRDALEGSNVYPHAQLPPRYSPYLHGSRVCPVSPTTAGSAFCHAVNGAYSHASQVQQVSTMGECYSAGSTPRRPPLVPHRSPVPPPAPRSSHGNSRSKVAGIATAERLLAEEDLSELAGTLTRCKQPPIPVARSSLKGSLTLSASVSSSTPPPHVAETTSSTMTVKEAPIPDADRNRRRPLEAQSSESLGLSRLESSTNSLKSNDSGSQRPVVEVFNPSEQNSEPIAADHSDQTDAGRPPSFVCQAATSASISNQGGSLTLEGTGVCLKVPRNALASSAEMFLKLLSTETVDGSSKEHNMVLVAGPAGLQFSSPVELCLPRCVFSELHRWYLTFQATNCLSDSSLGSTGDWQTLSPNGESVKKEANLDNVTFFVSNF